MNWISVEERLPQVNERVLVLFNGKTIEFSAYETQDERIAEWLEEETGPLPEWIPRGDHWIWGDNKITHWMPLPEPPK